MNKIKHTQYRIERQGENVKGKNFVKNMVKYRRNMGILKKSDQNFEKWKWFFEKCMAKKSTKKSAKICKINR